MALQATLAATNRRSTRVRSPMPASRVCPECGLSTDETRCPKDGRVTMSAALLEANEDPWLGRLVGGKVRIEACIGRGGMGAVYRARHLETDGLVAVKVLHPQAAERAQILRRFHLEAQNAASLRSVYTIRVIDYGVDGGTPFLIMEHLDGLPLSTVLRNEGRLPWRRALHIAAQIAKSLWEAHDHERRIIHRDIKPGNILIRRLAAGAVLAKVVDFGLARETEGDSDTTGDNNIMGTPAYMSPEQVQGRELDGRSDLYSLGVMLFQMLTGRSPFQRGSLQATLIAHLMEEAPALGEPPEGVDAWPPGFEDVLAKSMRINRDARQKRVSAFADELGQCVRPAGGGDGPPRDVVECPSCDYGPRG
jgi:serine/threonine protein kinase